MVFLEKLEELLIERNKKRPMNSYTTKLFNSGKDAILQKVGEEAIELIIASKNRKNLDDERAKKNFLHEFADLLFHMQVLLIEEKMKFRDVLSLLEERHRENKGTQEKNLR